MKPPTKKSLILAALTDKPMIAREIARKLKDIPANRVSVMLSQMHVDALVQRVDVSGCVPMAAKTYAYYRQTSP